VSAEIIRDDLPTREPVLEPVVLRPPVNFTPARPREARHKWRATKALMGWARDMELGAAMNMAAYAKKQGLSRTRFWRILREDPSISEAVFGGMATQAKAVVARGIIEAWNIVNDPKGDPKEKHRWVELAARLAGGGFDKRAAPQVVIANLIPSLPPGYAHIDAAKVIEHAVVTRMDELLGEEKP
jgi:hypothetical protein